MFSFTQPQLSAQLSILYSPKDYIHERNVHLMHFHYRYSTLIIWRVIFHQYNLCLSGCFHLHDWYLSLMFINQRLNKNTWKLISIAWHGWCIDIFLQHKSRKKSVQKSRKIIYVGGSERKRKIHEVHCRLNMNFLCINQIFSHSCRIIAFLHQNCFIKKIRQRERENTRILHYYSI